MAILQKLVQYNGMFGAVRAQIESLPTGRVRVATIDANNRIVELADLDDVWACREFLVVSDPKASGRYSKHYCM
jgi:hypothetical protein